MVKAWDKQKELQQQKIPSMVEMKNILISIPDERHRVLLTLMYLTAGRVSEIVEDLKKGDIFFTERKERKVMLIDMPNKKHKKRKRKEIPIPLDREDEGFFAQIIINYLRFLSDEDVLFGFSRQRAWQITQKYGFNPHFLRHIRLTHLVVYHDFNEFLLAKFAGWTDTRPAKHYMELRWTDILDKM